MTLKKIFKSLIYQLFLLPKILINYYLRKNNFYILWRKGKAIGDQVLMAGVARSLNLTFNSKIIVITDFPKVLSLSKWIFKCIDIKKFIFWKLSFNLLKVLEGERLIFYRFPYEDYGYPGVLDSYRNGLFTNLDSPQIWIAHVAHKFNRSVFKDFRGGLSRSINYESKKIIYKLRANFPKKKIGIINPLGKLSFTKSKTLGFDKYQQIINLTKDDIAWIQVGEIKSQKLFNIEKDMRGKDLVFLVDIISFSDLVLADEGLLNHIAASFPKVNSYVSFSLFQPINYYSYANTITVGKPKSEISNKEKYYWDKYIPNQKIINICPKLISKQILINEGKFK